MRSGKDKAPRKRKPHGAGEGAAREEANRERAKKKEAEKVAAAKRHAIADSSHLALCLVLQDGGAAAVANDALPGIAVGASGRLAAAGSLYLTYLVILGWWSPSAAAASGAELAADAMPGDAGQAAQQPAHAEQANAEQAIVDLKERRRRR